MKNRFAKDNPNRNSEKINGPESVNLKGKKKMKKNKMRLGGGGLSLEVFANAKTKSDHYNPAFIKKQREFYKNAKFVSKYKKSQKQQCQQNDPFLDIDRFPLLLQDGNESGEAGEAYQEKKKKKISTRSLRELYEKNRDEEEKVRNERKASVQAKKEERDRAKSRRKALREKMFKKTKSGQPVMKYRIEHLLQTIQGSKA